MATGMLTMDEGKRRPAAFAGRLEAGLLAGSVAALAGIAVAGAIGGGAVRPLVAVLAIFLLLAVALSRPRLWVVLAITYLVLVAGLRRVLIPVQPFTAYDPLLVVGPVFA